MTTGFWYNVLNLIKALARAADFKENLAGNAEVAFGRICQVMSSRTKLVENHRLALCADVGGRT